MPLAHELGVLDVLHLVQSQWGIEGRVRGDEYDILCPDPTHADSKPSCSVNLTSGLWKCLSCGRAGDLLSLGNLVTGEPYESIRGSLEPSSSEALLATVRTRLARYTSKPASRMAPEGALTEYRIGPGNLRRGHFEELYERGFLPETLLKWGVRYVEREVLSGQTGEFTISDSIGIPIRDQYSRLLAWCYRRTACSLSWQPRYLYTPGVSVSELWFGLQHHHSASEIAIVEGALDAMWLDQAGTPALALLGSEMGERKINQLKRYRRVVLFGDNDAAGAISVNRIGNIIGGSTSVWVVTYPQKLIGFYASGGETKLDPGALAAVDVELLLAQAVPWTTWLTRRNA